MFVCPRCSKTAVTTRGLAKHLSGTVAYGGHDLDPVKAQAEAEAASRAEASLAPRQPAPAPHSAPAPRKTPMQQPAPYPPAASGDFIDQLFAQMARDKALPKYQFERRVDAFLAILLPDLLAQTFGGEVSYVVPEFPIKKPGNNQSTNVDHVYFDHRGWWLFVEIKTDSDSESDTQVGTYLSAIARGMPALITDIHDIRAATAKRAKYDRLLERLTGYPLDRPVELVYLAPTGSELRFPPAVKLLDYARLAGLNHRTHPGAAFRNRLVPALT